MTTINATLNDIMKTTTLGDFRSPVGAALYGINHRMTPGPVPINRDYHGLVLLTRPQLNLTPQNVRAMRAFIPLLTTEEVSIQRMVRKLLDPRLTNELCPLVDDRQAFIPILTNHALSLSGFPDPYVNSRLTNAGVAKEVTGQIDDIVDLYHAYDINISFRNMVGDPITTLFYTWIQYASAVFRGVMIPYPDFIAANEYDYNTRIWRLVLDRNKRFVTKIACTGAAYPRNVPLGAAFDFAHDKPLNSNNETINISFQAFGACYNDPILIYEFNKTVGIFNPDMREDATGALQGRMVQVPFAELQWFNNRGYPRIDPESLELQWYVTPGEFETVIRARSRTVQALVNR